MALWNHLVPDLVQLSVQERETEKLPRYPTLESDYGGAGTGGSESSKNSGNRVIDSHDNRNNPQKTPTYVKAGHEISEVSTISTIVYQSTTI